MFSKKFTVEFDSRLIVNTGTASSVMYHADRILIAPPTDTYSRSATDVYVNWLCEVIRVFLMFTKNEEAQKDTAFVALFARALHQVIMTAKFDDGKKDFLFRDIPVEFQVFGKTFTVAYDKSILYHNQCVGMAEFHKDQVLLHPNDETLERSFLDEYQTFMHELVHIILMSICEVELNEDESFVNMMGAALAQTFTTAEY